jgi:hypothetical protein
MEEDLVTLGSRTDDLDAAGKRQISRRTAHQDLDRAGMDGITPALVVVAELAGVQRKDRPPIVTCAGRICKSPCSNV